jgi:hypothetical protein
MGDEDKQVTEQENIEGAEETTEETTEETADVEGHAYWGPESRLEPGSRGEPGLRA